MGLFQYFRCLLAKHSSSIFFRIYLGNKHHLHLIKLYKQNSPIFRMMCASPELDQVTLSLHTTKYMNLVLYSMTRYIYEFYVTTQNRCAPPNGIWKKIDGYVINILNQICERISLGPFSQINTILKSLPCNAGLEVLAEEQIDRKLYT